MIGRMGCSRPAVFGAFIEERWRTPVTVAQCMAFLFTWCHLGAEPRWAENAL